MARIGLVLGAGGILGSAWMVGALANLEVRLGRPLGEVDLIIGTSAGSVHAAALRCGMTVAELVAHQRGVPLAEAAPDLDGGDLPDMRAIERECGDGRPPLPLPWIGSPRLLVSAATRPRSLNPVVVAAGLLPAGRGQMGALVRMVIAMQIRYGITTDGWVPGTPLWVVAVDYDSGQRVVFGRDGAPPTTVGDAVLASCSIPGWFAPRVIDGRRYVDGGVASSTSVGLLARPDAPQLDEVYVLAPMASHVYDRPRDPVACMERAVRRVLTRWLDAEVRAVRAATGARVSVITPGPADLTAMGGNLMSPRHRARVLDTALDTSVAALVEADEQTQAA